jgi:lipopolysaccharide/colanic/teichoic acid biosynthesis glycosyltransferase
MLILESEETIFLDVIALAVNVMLILESKETNFFKTTVFGCNRTSCKRYYNLRF